MVRGVGKRCTTEFTEHTEIAQSSNGDLAGDRPKTSINSRCALCTLWLEDSPELRMHVDREGPPSVPQAARRLDSKQVEYELCGDAD